MGISSSENIRTCFFLFWMTLVQQRARTEHVIWKIRSIGTLLPHDAILFFSKHTLFSMFAELFAQYFSDLIM